MKIQSGTLNVLQLATGFLLSYFSLGSHSFIVQTIIDQKHKESVVDEHAGYVSAAIMYMVFTFANFIAAPVVGSLGARWAMVTSSVIISVFLAGFLFLNEPFLYISSALLGIGSAIIWTAQGKYIAMNSTDETASMHSSLFWGVSQVCVTGGGLFLYFEFKDLGADDKISDSKITVLYIILTVIAIVGIVIFALLRMPKRDESLVDPEVKPEPEKTFSELICSTFNLLLTKRMFFLAIAFTYTGVELSFTSAVYPTAISFTRKLATNTRTIIAFDAIAVGLGHATGGFLFGTLGGITKRLGRITIVLIGTIIHFFVFVAVYFNFPNDSPLKETDSQGTIKPPNVAISIICGYFLAFGDACWNTQIFSLLVSRYNKKSAEAFSLFKFFQSLATAIAFWYATHLKLLGHLIILFITGILGCAAFAIGNKLPTTSREAGDRPALACRRNPGPSQEMSVPHSPTDEKEKQGKPDWQGQLSEDEDLPLDDERLEQLREEQGVRGIPEVDIPPEFESDEDLPVPTENLGNSNMFEQTGSSFQSRSETRQNRNLATGSASSERLSAVDAIEHADLDDFEEEERRVQKELESSGEHEFRGSLQNRQEVFSEAVRENVEDEYDSDYPEGHQVQYPKEPPPAYSSPPKSPSRVEPIQEENDDYYDSEDEERGEEAKNFFGENTTGVSALAAGGLALVGGVHKISQENTDLDPEGEEGRSSQESYRFNDAIRDQSPVDRGGQLPPIEPAKSPESQPKREESTPEAAYAMTNDLKNLLQVVEQYHAVNIEVEPYLVPFDVNYVPAVGDVHPGIGIPRPDGVEDYLGLVVLDEPSSKQSNSTVINMLLKDKKAPDEPVKKLFRPDKNTKAIEQWIENIKEVRRTNPPDRLAYSRPMPDIEKLMEEWNPEFDSILRGSKLPTAAIDATTEEFADLVLAYADIPVHASRIQSLHLLFSLYNEFKNSQHFRNAAYGTGANTETDRLEL